jgi:tRNA/tmRNA/rRNA uracil-C5-methylase (TrmA/RlmC/RlmD family)
MEPGSLVTLDIEKPAVGGRMLARHNGRVVLVWGGIPGERVTARIERAGRGVLYAEAADVVDASPDRRDSGPDWRCGGSVYAHIAYERQVRLKGEIIRETFGRIGRVLLREAPIVIASPERGYRMRARLHADAGRFGFFREGSHQLCDPELTGQFLPGTLVWIRELERALEQQHVTNVVGLELAENVPGDERAFHLDVEPGSAPEPLSQISDRSSVTDAIRVREDDPSSIVRLRRSPRAFFQGNRFLLETLVRHVAALVPDGPIVDLYAGVGLFGLSLAAAAMRDVTLVEGDPISAADLVANAEPFRDRARVVRSSVEGFLAASARRSGRSAVSHPHGASSVIVDPPRTGVSKEALAGIIHATPTRVVYVSCDIATLARDSRTLIDAGYALEGVTGLDMFPNTAHVETVAVFEKQSDR